MTNEGKSCSNDLLFILISMHQFSVEWCIHLFSVLNHVSLLQQINQVWSIIRINHTNLWSNQNILFIPCVDLRIKSRMFYVSFCVWITYRFEREIYSPIQKKRWSRHVMWFWPQVCRTDDARIHYYWSIDWNFDPFRWFHSSFSDKNFGTRKNHWSINEKLQPMIEGYLWVILATLIRRRLLFSTKRKNYLSWSQSRWLLSPLNGHQKNATM